MANMYESIIVSLCLLCLSLNCGALTLSRLRLITDPLQDFWESINAQPEVFIQCSSDGGKNYEIKSETINLNDEQTWVDGPWELSDWLPRYGSTLYCQAYEDDTLVEQDSFLSFFFNTFQNEFLGDNILKSSDFEDNDTVVSLTFYIRKDLSERPDNFLKGIEAEFTCPECVGKNYPPHPYFVSESSVWPVQVFEQCTATQGPKGMELLSQGFCCKVSNPQKLGDGNCDFVDYNTEVCGFDLGDCLNPPPSASPSPLTPTTIPTPTPTPTPTESTPLIIPSQDSFSDLDEVPFFSAPIQEINPVESKTKLILNRQQNFESGETNVPGCISIFEILKDRSDLELFYSILNATSVINQLENFQDFTLLVPTENAIQQFIQQQQLQTENLLSDPQTLEILEAIMKLHVLVAEQFQLIGSELAEGGLLVGTLLNAQLLQLVSTETGGIEVVPPNNAAPRAQVIPDETILTCEGVIYFIDTVLIPIFISDDQGV